MSSHTKSLLREMDRAYHRLPFQVKEVQRVERRLGTEPFSYAEVSDPTDTPATKSNGGASAEASSNDEINHSVRPTLYRDLTYNTATEEFIYHPEEAVTTTEIQQDGEGSDQSTCVDSDSDSLPDNGRMGPLDVKGTKHSQVLAAAAAVAPSPRKRLPPS